MAVIGRATVDCINAETCGGRAELELSDYIVALPTGSDATMVNAREINGTCQCDLDEDQRDTMIDRARRQLNA